MLFRSVTLTAELPKAMILLGAKIQFIVEALRCCRCEVERWQANGALLPAVRALVNQIVGIFGGSYQLAGRLARVCLAGTAAFAALWISRRPIADAADLLARVSLLTLIVVLTSPAQFPWYAIWTLAFLPFAPRWGVLAMAVQLPIYYASFYFTAINAFPVFRDKVVWLIWIPIWSLLAAETLRSGLRHRHAKANAGSP